MKKLLALLTMISAISLLVTGCGGERNEKQEFIDATVEATCLVFQAEDIFDPALEDEAKQIYRDHGFPADDDTAMEALTEKYRDDAEVNAAIEKAVEECAGDFMTGLEEAFGDMDMEVDEEADEDMDTTEDTEVTEEPTEEPVE